MPDYGIFDLSGKVALVTGASRGIGRAIAITLAEYGADVACTGRDMNACAVTIEQVEKFGHRAIPIKADMTSEEDIQKMVEY